MTTGAVQQITADEARHAALRAQGLLGTDLNGGVDGLLRRVGAVQLDTISVLARYPRAGCLRAPGRCGTNHGRTGVLGTAGAGFGILRARQLRAAHRGLAVLRFPPSPVAQKADARPVRASVGQGARPASRRTGDRERSGWGEERRRRMVELVRIQARYRDALPSGRGRVHVAQRLEANLRSA